jgi:hypothetical protein
MNADNREKLFSDLIKYRTNQYRSHCSYLLRHFLLPYVMRLPPHDAGDACLDLASAWPRMAVLVDNRLNDLWLMTLLNTWLLTPEDTLVMAIVEPDQVEKARHLLQISSAPRQIVVSDGSQHGLSDRLSQHVYNALFKKPSFWSSLPADSILVVQTDAQLIQPMPVEFFDYTFLAAPWGDNLTISDDFPRYTSAGVPCGMDRLTRRFWPDQTETIKLYPHFYGNGGLSMRSRPVMHKICQHHSGSSDYLEPEDVFFSAYLGRYSNLAPRHIASVFASETTWNPDVIGFHASWLYLSSSQQAHYYETHAKTLISMTCQLLTNCDC